jgi:hypothetical protein
MLKKKNIGIALACALALGAWSGSTIAAPINVGGVVWDPSHPLDLTVQALNFRESQVDSMGDVLLGYGVIGSINGSTEAALCPGCDLTFTFTYTVKNVNPVVGAPRIVFDNGTINFYVKGDNSFNVLDPSSAAGATPWLTLKGHTFADADPLFLTDGELFASIVGSSNNPSTGSNGFGYLDATGGIAMPHVDTNFWDTGAPYGFADFRLNSSFLFDGVPICGADGTCYPISGTGTLYGRTAVPEPGALGMLGLGLSALGFAVWRRRKEAEGRA